MNNKILFIICNAAIKFCLICTFIVFFTNYSLAELSVEPLDDTTEEIIEPDYTLSDPFEPFNRAIFHFNLFLDDWVLRPVAVAYQDFVPFVVRHSTDNVIENLKEPLTLINNILQLRPKEAVLTLGRFLLNSTFGLLGTADIAQRANLEHAPQTFSMTLIEWGVKPGPYLMLPILGPSTPRDVTGRAIGFYGEPINLVVPAKNQLGIALIRGGLDVLDKRTERLGPDKSLRESSLDFYATIKSIVEQNQNRHDAHITEEGGPVPTDTPE